MRIAYLAAGAAGSYCGACACDAALARGLRAAGHDVALVPLYTPLRVDGPDPGAGGVFLGGINCWLQQRCGLFRRTPRFVDWLLDRPALLRLASRFAVETAPERLGPMTVSVLRGADGRQRKELARLLRFLASDVRPEVVNLTNSLLSGLAPAIKSKLGVPVVCTLQGEESFIGRLPSPFREEAQALLRSNAEAVDLFVAPAAAYAAEMAEYLAVGRERVCSVLPGIDVAPYAAGQQGESRPDGAFRIGFLSRISPAKGLDILVEAFRLLERERPAAAVLAVAGQSDAAGKRFWNELASGLAKDGLAERVEFAGEVDLAGKVDFLGRCSVFCLPSRHPERRAVAALEALAAGVPVVGPVTGLFPEIVALTGGGVLVPPADPQGLAAALAALRDDPERRARMSRAAAQGARRHFSVEAMAARMIEVYGEVIGAGG